MSDGVEIAGLFVILAPSAKINMASFWVSYVHVEDLDGTVANAKSLDGVIAEIAPEAFATDARIALIRDPSGAHFIV